MQNFKNILKINPRLRLGMTRMIIMGDENLKKYVFNLTVSSYYFLPRQTTKRRNLHWSWPDVQSNDSSKNGT